MLGFLAAADVGECWGFERPEPACLLTNVDISRHIGTAQDANKCEHFPPFFCGTVGPRMLRNVKVSSRFFRVVCPRD